MRATVNEYPCEPAMWLEAFQVKYDGTGTFEKEQWDQSLGDHSVSPCTASKELQICSVEYREQSVCDLPAVAFGPELMDAYPAKISSPTDPIHGMTLAPNHYCKRQSTGCTTCCNTSTASPASSTPYTYNTGNVSSMTIASRMEKRSCAHITQRSEPCAKDGSESFGLFGLGDEWGALQIP